MKSKIDRWKEEGARELIDDLIGELASHVEGDVSNLECPDTYAALRVLVHQKARRFPNA